MTDPDSKDLVNIVQSEESQLYKVCRNQIPIGELNVYESSGRVECSLLLPYCPNMTTEAESAIKMCLERIYKQRFKRVIIEEIVSSPLIEGFPVRLTVLGNVVLDKP